MLMYLYIFELIGGLSFNCFYHLVKMAIFGQKGYFGAFFCPKMAKAIFFFKYLNMSLPYDYKVLALCTELEKPYERIPRSRSKGLTDVWTDERE